MDLCPSCLLAAGFATGSEDSTRFTPLSPEELGRFFPELEVIELLGRGGMGAVYKARQRELDRVVAVKILPPDIGHDRAFSERFTREARALAKLNHPHIVTLYDFGQKDGLYYFFMEYVDGINLRQLFNGKRISPDEALAIVPQICDALQYAHDRGIVHRDIKPENILIGKDGQVKIADFGVAKIVGAVAGETVPGSLPGSEPEMTEAGRVLGTPQYMAPEQGSHPTEVDHRADIYSLGVVFYQMLTGELPGKQIERPSKKIQIDVRLDAVVLRALAANPEQRYQQASLFKTGVEQVTAAPVASQERAPFRAFNEDIYAGFWRRAVALVIDYALVATFIVFPLSLIIATYWPDRIVVSVPFDLFTEEHVFPFHKEEKKHSDGSTTIEEYRFVEVRPLGRWTYLFKEESQRKGGEMTTTRKLLDPETKQERKTTSTGELTFLLLLFYWSLMESSRWQASVGKRIMRFRVMDKDGQRLSLLHAAARNAWKIVSLFTLCIGFMMAGWTSKKQALHDLLARCVVVQGVPERARKVSLSFRNWTAIISGVIIATLLAFFSTRSYERLERNQSEVRKQIKKDLSEARRALRVSEGAVIPRLLDELKAGNTQSTVERFLEADWTQVPLFRPGSALSVSEDEFAALSARDRALKSTEIQSDIDALRRLVDVAEVASSKAVAKGDFTYAKRSLETMKSFGKALNHSESTLLLQLFGQAVEKKATRRLAELQPSETREKAVVETLNTASNPETAPANAKPTMVLPQLRALNWQEWVRSKASMPWSPSGKAVSGDVWMPEPAQTSVKEGAETKKNSPRFLCLWFSHPLFDDQSVANVTLMDAEGKNPLKVPNGAVAMQYNRNSDSGVPAEVGWITVAISGGSEKYTPSLVTVSLRYSLGAWTKEQVIHPDFKGAEGLPSGVMLGAIGQDSRGYAFIQLTRDTAVNLGEEQYGFVALLRNGRRLERRNARTYGSGNFLMEQFSFQASLSEVESFEFRKRPIRSMTEKAVLLSEPIAPE